MEGGFGNEMVVYGEYDVKLVVHGGKLLELVAYINTNGGPSRREHSECRYRNVHPPQYGTGVRGYFRDSVQFLIEFVWSTYA
jgi:hypothetical protein